jgi:predicted transposase YbfD/YdcC
MHSSLSGDKGGEIAAAQELIQTLGLTGKLFTFDALHCPKKR